MFNAWSKLMSLALRESFKEVRPFMLRQFLMLCAVLLSFFAVSLAAAILESLPSAHIGHIAAHKLVKIVAVGIVCVYGLVSGSAFVLEVRRDLKKNAKRRKKDGFRSRADEDVEIPAAIQQLHLAKMRRRGRILAQSETLAATPSLLQGVGSIIDIGDTLTQYNDLSDEHEADNSALQHDQLMVSRDFNRGLESAVKKLNLENTMQRTEYVDG